LVSVSYPLHLSSNVDVEDIGDELSSRRVSPEGGVQEKVLARRNPRRGSMNVELSAPESPVFE
jgi:hypothetical protein